MTLAANLRYQAQVAQQLGRARARKPVVRVVPIERALPIRYPAAVAVAYLAALREIVAVLERAIAAEVLPALPALVQAQAATRTDAIDPDESRARASQRIAIIGAPRAGKTTRALELGERLGLPVHHADDLIALGWSEASEALARSIGAVGHDGRAIWEGVAVVRALRKLISQSADKPVDQVLVLRQPHLALSPGQQRMAAACETVLREIEPELRARGVEFVDDASQLLELAPPPTDQPMHQMHHDAVGDSVPVLFERVREEVTAQLPTARIAMLAQQNALRVSEHNKSEVDAQIKQVVKIDLFHPETGVPDHIHAFVSQQVALVKGLTESTLLSTQATVLEGIRQGLRHETIAANLVKEVGLSKTRAGVIAGDQVAKLNGELTRLRQSNLGIKRYRWATSGDVHVRPAHRALNGTVQYWNKPPVVNTKTGKRAHPGDDTNFYACRCSAIAIVADLLEETGLQPTAADVPAMPPANDPAAAPTPRRRPLPAVPPALPQPQPANVLRPAAVAAVPPAEDTAQATLLLQALAQQTARKLPPPVVHALGGLADAELDYLRTGMRDLRLHLGAYAGASEGEVNAIAAGLLASKNTGELFAPITLSSDVVESVRAAGRLYVLVDGRHRLAAARAAGASFIAAIIDGKRVIIPVPRL